jgi:formate dehydrogenase subunit delta
MNNDRLVTMANDIATFFRAGDKTGSARSTAAHIRRYWDPRMRKRIIEHLSEGGEGLSELAHDAIGLLAQESMRV